MQDFEETMERAAKVFIKDVVDTGKETLTVELDREDGDFTMHIGRAGGMCLPLDPDFESEGASYYASVFTELLIAMSGEMNINLNFELTINKDELAEITVTRLSKESMN